jgi:hypothetical protein
MKDVILCFLCLLKQNKTKIVYFDVNDIGILLDTCFYNCSFPFSFNRQIISTNFLFFRVISLSIEM